MPSILLADKIPAEEMVVQVLSNDEEVGEEYQVHLQERKKKSALLAEKALDRHW